VTAEPMEREERANFLKAYLTHNTARISVIDDHGKIWLVYRKTMKEIVEEYLWINHRKE
jgi:hypothetical protein